MILSERIESGSRVERWHAPFQRRAESIQSSKASMVPAGMPVAKCQAAYLVRMPLMSPSELNSSFFCWRATRRRRPVDPVEEANSFRIAAFFIQALMVLNPSRSYFVRRSGCALNSVLSSSGMAVVVRGFTGAGAAKV